MSEIQTVSQEDFEAAMQLAREAKTSQDIIDIRDTLADTSMTGLIRVVNSDGSERTARVTEIGAEEYGNILKKANMISQDQINKDMYDTNQSWRNPES